MRSRCLLLAFALASATAAAQVREEPLWEAGLGLAGLYFPDYRGSDRSRGYVLPAPYFVYRGDFLRADRHGLRSVFFNNDRFDLNMSVGASLPVDSEDNPARAGMPDLKPSVELGPALDINLWRHANGRTKLDLRLPVRGAFTIESSPRGVGWEFHPNLNVDIHAPGGLTGWNLGLRAGLMYADDRHARYFYEVKPEFATATRPAYQAQGGYAGAQVIVALSKRFPKYWVGGFLRYDSLRGAAFEDSPLVTSKNYFAAGIGISWIFAESSTRVVVDPFDERKK